MIELGKIQKLEVIRIASVGAYLNTINSRDEDVLLPNNKLDENLNLGDEIEVFVYRDSEDRMIATTTKPKITLGELAYLQVVDVTKIGAFVDWGLEKDLLLPFSEQSTRVKVNGQYLMGMYIDKTGRLCATMDIYHQLLEDAPYKEDAKVLGTVYSINEDIGVFVAVDNLYCGLIPNSEVFRTYKIGEQIEARVSRRRDDGKLDLSLREKAHLQMNDDAQIILEKLELSGGSLPLNDKSDPQEIKAAFKMSKNAFKRAIGRLLKENKIEFVEGGIKIKREIES
ncbi:S1-like domain-containing RNA-binding protein [Serpentinicella sp. ANB-PHB4]|uniref:CvfB family protein n=1 Tax=Serpentinicella sp. ANB-PHB4 TaxID=3074076 RepID=UPI002855BED1|nr:S1-like domain-containing RNA-binding protein [Serpentinicella sp. ANB-PHB4]MDR5658516.1 S1-like domain-containing RNA-binding protein [Serpentinicella sp. ANB-PHB4]